MADQLSKTYTYKLRTPDEVWWRFRYDDYVDYTGHHWGWQVYQCNPGAVKPQRIGMWKEGDVIKHLVTYGHKLDGEDWDDLRLWTHLQWERDINTDRDPDDTLST